MQVSTVNKVVEGGWRWGDLGHGCAIEALKSLAFLELSVMGKGKSRISKGENAPMEQQEDAPNSENTHKLNEIYRFLSKLPKSDGEKT